MQHRFNKITKYLPPFAFQTSSLVHILLADTRISRSVTTTDLRRLIEVLRRLINGSLMKIITISIANWVDQRDGWRGLAHRKGARNEGLWTNHPWSSEGWPDRGRGRDERIGPEAKYVLVQSNLRAMGLDMAARGKEQFNGRCERKLWIDGGCAFCDARCQATPRQRIENYCCHGLLPNWIMKYSAPPPLPLTSILAFIVLNQSTDPFYDFSNEMVVEDWLHSRKWE